jgi:hypothetical protein
MTTSATPKIVVTAPKSLRGKVARVVIRNADNSQFSSMTVHGATPREVDRVIRDALDLLGKRQAV